MELVAIITVSRCFASILAMLFTSEEPRGLFLEPFSLFVLIVSLAAQGLVTLRKRFRKKGDEIFFTHSWAMNDPVDQQLVAV